MRASNFLALLFTVLALVTLGVAVVIGWAVLGSESDADMQRAILLGAAGTAALVFTIAGAWVMLQLRLVRPLDALTREVQTLSRADTPRLPDTPEGQFTSDLSRALQDLLSRFAAARNDRQDAIDEAMESGETYRRRLETILLDLSEGVIVCNLDDRVLLYNQAAMQILKRPEALGLGRRLFSLFQKKPIRAAVKELTAKQRADRKNKLRIRRRIKCGRTDGGADIEAHLALICSDEVETEGYVLTFAPTAGTDEDVAMTLPPRPEFYDFDLFKREPGRRGKKVPLKELRCIVFDTETTGLAPSKGDEIISIGAVRIINGRIVRGETFEQLVNPGRKIPQSSIRFHGITDDDVKGKPGLKSVLPQFHRFCGSAALVAHNAAFDMRFLELKEKTAGVSFTNPVLDILLLSAFLHDHTEDHSMDASAKRLGVEVSGRHTALGDAMTTAAIFIAMLDPLEARGVVTLGDALKVSSEQVKIRKMQAQF